MKTIRAIFTKEKQDVPIGKSYTYNTTLDVQIGDLIGDKKSVFFIDDKYLQVIGIEEVAYKFYTIIGGKFKLLQDPTPSSIPLAFLGADAIIIYDDITDVEFED